MQECTKVLSDDEYLQQMVDTYNNNEGKNLDNSSLFDIYNCPVCRNKLTIAFIDSMNSFSLRQCSCRKLRKSLVNIEKSGLSGEIRTKTFESYIVSQPWQNLCKEIAIKYLNDYSGKWLFAGGQSGSGKTHLCTAICGKMLNKGVSVKYVLWRELVQKLSSNRFSDDYRKIFDNLLDADVLYIDDFLKSHDPRKELDWAFEIINACYTSRKSLIISSELLIDDINLLDSAIAGRISEMSNGFKIQIIKNPDRNYRIVEIKKGNPL